MKLKDLKTNVKNPRILKDARFKKLLNKILVYPNLLTKRKITFDSSQGNTVLGGNQRLNVLKHISSSINQKSLLEAIKNAQDTLGVNNELMLNNSLAIFTDLQSSKEIPNDWVQDTNDLSEDEKKAFVLIDNLNDGEWDFDVIANEWELDTYEWGLINWQISSAEDDNIFNTEDDLDDIDEDAPPPVENKGISSDNYSAFEIVMLHENKKKVFEVLNKIKQKYNLENFEQSLLKLIEIYNY